MDYKKFKKKLKTSALIKWRLFNKLRQGFENIDFLDYEHYQEGLESIPSLLVAEWREVENHYKNNPDIDIKSLKGFLFEAFFYYACLRTEARFKDVEILGVTEKGEDPPWFEATPLFDIVPPLHHIHKKRKGKIVKNPQTKADFLVTYVNHAGPLPPALVDVKSNKPSNNYLEKFGWQVISAMRRGFIFLLAYPKIGVKYPKSLEEWETLTYCPNCKRLSKSYRKCDNCGKIIFRFTIVDAYYKKNKRNSE